MSTEIWIALGILAAAILLFITERLRVDVVAIGVMVALMLTGLLTPQEALSGFSNPAVLTIAALFIIGGAIMQTGLARSIGNRLLSIAGSGTTRLTLIIMGTVALLSAFISDSGTVAVLLPAITSMALSTGVSTSKLLLPLSYGALLGGATTLIGTPPNILVSDLLHESGYAPFSFFDYTPIGLLTLSAGIVYMLLAGRRLLPDHRPSQVVQKVHTPEELIELYKLPDNLFRLRVRRGSRLINNSLVDSQISPEFELVLLRILRPKPDPVGILDIGETFSTRQEDYENIPPYPDLIFNSGDIVIVQGNAGNVSHAAATLNLGVLPAEFNDAFSLVTNEIGISEILLPPRSALVGKTIVETKFGSRYNLTVLSINRPGTTGSLPLKTTPLRFGDTLLVQGAWKNILKLRDKRRDFVVMGEPEQMLSPPARKKAPLALGIMAVLLLLLITNVIPVVTASLLAAFVLILTGCVTIDEAYEAVDWRSIVLIAGMLPMSVALEKVGIIEIIAEGMTESLGELGPVVLMGGLFLLTSVLTQVLSNTATTVLIAPVGMAAASNMGIQPHAFLMAIAIAASMAFATPVASPVNTLVMGTGSYRFSDYIKVGTPLILVAFIISLIVLPYLWPFYG
jgi:di/tricarboxylate transporter